MAELSYDDFAYHAYTTAYFKLEASEDKQSDIVFYGYQEEVGELLNNTDHPEALTSKLWGQEVDPAVGQQLDEDETSEAGDVLYFVTAAGMLRNISLREMMLDGLERYTGQSDITASETFSAFDGQLRGRMSDPVPQDYRPNYHTLKLWDFAPFHDTLHIVLSEPTYAKGPLQLIGDGRYALERLHSNFGRFMLPESSNDDEFIASAGLVLGGLSIVLQHRFNSSMKAAALNNIAKRERRLERKALLYGNDPERSRPAHVPRPQLGSDESTRNNLLEAALPFNVEHL
jgi:hypothetical protein